MHQVESLVSSPDGLVQNIERFKKQTGQDTRMTINEFMNFVSQDWCDPSTAPPMPFNATVDENCCVGIDPQTGAKRSRPVCGAMDSELYGGDPDLRSGKGLGINRRTQSWNVAAATFAYAFGSLAELDYAFVGMDQLIGGVWPDNSPSVSMLDWQTGQPNAKYWVTTMLASTVGSAKEKAIVASNVSLANGTLTGGSSSIPQPVYVMPYVMEDTQGVLLVNKKQTAMDVTIDGVVGGSALVVEVALSGPDAAEPGFAPTVAKELSADGKLSLGPFGVAVVTQLRMSAAQEVVSGAAAAIPCATDTDCPYDGAFRCCGTTARAENCPAPSHAAGGGNCVLPGTTGKTLCACAASKCAVSQHPLPVASKKQWLMIGDSISDGCFGGPLPSMANASGIQVVHNPTNAANVWWGSHCLDGWLDHGTPGGASRWDVITFQFGL